MHFEQHVRSALATGATARQVQDMLLHDSNFFLPTEEATAFCATLPKIRWFQAQREALGLESYLYGFMRIAAAERIIQWGFDETTLDGVSCLNQWALLEFGVEEGSGEGTVQGHTVVTLECAGVVPGGTADEIVAHIEKAWERGQAAVDALRAELTFEDRDTLCPLVNGGVNLHKLFGVMHDTCHCANLVATRIVELHDLRKREFLSEEVYFPFKPPPVSFPLTLTLTLPQTFKVWELTSPQSRVVFNFLCGNHTRNLPIDRYRNVPLSSYPNPYPHPAFLCLCLCLSLPLPWPIFAFAYLLLSCLLSVYFS